MVYVFIGLLVLGVIMAMPAVIYLALRQSDSMMGEAAQMIPAVVFIIWLLFAGGFVLAGLLGLLL
jgi:hypothetical protein